MVPGVAERRVERSPGPGPARRGPGRARSGHGGIGRVALFRVPSGPNAVAITARVRALLAEGGIPETVIPSALDLLALFVTAAALDRVPVALSTPERHRELLRWEIEVILNGLAATAGPADR